MQALTSSEATRLAELEEQISSGLATFVAVGQALLEVRDRRLYRQTHATFEAYCRERWGIGRSHSVGVGGPNRKKLSEILSGRHADGINPVGGHTEPTVGLHQPARARAVSRAASENAYLFPARDFRHVPQCHE